MKPISIEEIEYASRILFNGDPTKFYDNIQEKTGERVSAIKSLESKQIIACPGSGKTTVLLAKLIILARRMPFDDGRGICVLTHTNVAIDLIKEKLGVEASKLFAYPNFFGTIQSFVDKFLAVQSLIEEYNKRPNRIDVDIANQKLKNEFSSLQWDSALNRYLFNHIYSSESKIFNNKNLHPIIGGDDLYKKTIIARLKSKKIFNGKTPPHSLNYDEAKNISNQKDLPENVSNYIKLIHKHASETAQNKNEKFELLKYFSVDWEHKKIKDGYNNLGLETQSGADFKRIKESCFEDGVISYQDAYDFGKYYLFKHPFVREAFLERFKFVFIDEMQDTATHQSNIINTLFKNSDKTVVQEFGDPNQAIYDYDGQNGEWIYDVKNCLHLANSKRFGNQIASIINPLKIKSTDPEINGENPESVLPPHLIIFDESQLDYTNKVLYEFGKLIVENKLHKCEKKKFVAVGRVGKGNKDGKITLKTYWNGFEKKAGKSKEYYPTLIEYLQKDFSHNKFNYSKQIINGVLHLLELLHFKNEFNKRFTKTTLFNFLENENEKLYHEFRIFITDCGLMIKNRETDYCLDVHTKIVKFVKDKLLPIKKIEFENVEDFTQISQEIKENREENKTNTYTYDDKKGNMFPIKINTIHGEKGETHTATLYLETYYRKYDSEKIKEQLKGTNLGEDEKADKRMSAKLAYVAMSRPEKLLCFAVSSTRMTEQYARDNLKSRGWQIRCI